MIMREAEPVVRVPQQTERVICPGTPCVASTMLEIVPLMVMLRPAMRKISPPSALRGFTVMDDPSSTTMSQVVRISMPGACCVLTPSGKRFVLMVALFVTNKRFPPRSKMAFQLDGSDGSGFSYLKKAHKSASPTHVGTSVLKSTVTLSSTTTSKTAPSWSFSHVPQVSVSLATAISDGITKNAVVKTALNIKALINSFFVIFFIIFYMSNKNDLSPYRLKGLKNKEFLTVFSKQILKDTNSI